MYLELEGEFTCRPITYEDLAKDHASLCEIYQFRQTVDDPSVLEHLDVVLALASDSLCNTCHDMNIDPSILDYWQPGLDYIVTPFKPGEPDAEDDE